MEPDRLHATPSMGHPPSRERQRQQPAQRGHIGRSLTVAQGRTLREQKLRRTASKAIGKFGSTHHAKAKGTQPSRSATVKLYSPTATQPSPLLPLAERRSQEDKPPYHKSTGVSHDESKVDLTPDGGSAGREGRQFAVWNVGNNGRIYLRYVGWRLPAQETSLVDVT